MDLLNVAIIERYLYVFINGFSQFSRKIFSDSYSEELILEDKKSIDIIIKSISLPKSRNLLKIDNNANKLKFDKDNIDNSSYSVKINLELEEEYVSSLPLEPNDFSERILSDLIDQKILVTTYGDLEKIDNLFMFECKRLDDIGNVELSIPHNKLIQKIKNKVKTGSGDLPIFSLREQGGSNYLKLKGGQLANVRADKKNSIEKKSSSAQTSPLYSFKDEHGETIKFTITDLVTNKGKVKNSKGKYVTPKLKKSKPSSLSSMVNSWKPKGK